MSLLPLAPCHDYAIAAGERGVRLLARFVQPPCWSVADRDDVGIAETIHVAEASGAHSLSTTASAENAQEEKHYECHVHCFRQRCAV